MDRASDSSAMHLNTLCILIDTREKEPYAFESIPSVRRHLDTGDYSLRGLENGEDGVCVERKSSDDLAGTLMNKKRRSRFFDEICRMSGMPGACIVVECTVDDIMNNKYASSGHPHSILGFVRVIREKYGVPTFFFLNRQFARCFVENYLYDYYQLHTGNL